jgi:hypothetical protein
MYSFDSVIVGPIPMEMVSGLMIYKLRRKNPDPIPEPTPPIFNYSGNPTPKKGGFQAIHG